MKKKIKVLFCFVLFITMAFTAFERIVKALRIPFLVLCHPSYRKILLPCSELPFMLHCPLYPWKNLCRVLNHCSIPLFQSMPNCLFFLFSFSFGAIISSPSLPTSPDYFAHWPPHFQDLGFSNLWTFFFLSRAISLWLFLARPPKKHLTLILFTNAGS